MNCCLFLAHQALFFIFFILNMVNLFIYIIYTRALAFILLLSDIAFRLVTFDFYIIFICFNALINNTTVINDWNRKFDWNIKMKTVWIEFFKLLKKKLRGKKKLKLRLSHPKTTLKLIDNSLATATFGFTSPWNRMAWNPWTTGFT